jgi:nuclear pore complex protein Nup107
MSSDELHASCAEVLAWCQANKDDLAKVLDPETGFAPRMRELCLDQCVQALHNPTLLVQGADPWIRF